MKKTIAIALLAFFLSACSKQKCVECSLLYDNSHRKVTEGFCGTASDANQFENVFLQHYGSTDYYSYPTYNGYKIDSLNCYDK